MPFSAFLPLIAAFLGENLFSLANLAPFFCSIISFKSWLKLDFWLSNATKGVPSFFILYFCSKFLSKLYASLKFLKLIPPSISATSKFAYLSIILLLYIFQFLPMPFLKDFSSPLLSIYIALFNLSLSFLSIAINLYSPYNILNSAIKSGRPDISTSPLSFSSPLVS